MPERSEDQHGKCRSVGVGCIALLGNFERVHGRIESASVRVLAAIPSVSCEIRTRADAFRLEWGPNDKWPTPAEALTATIMAYSPNVPDHP